MPLRGSFEELSEEDVHDQNPACGECGDGDGQHGRVQRGIQRGAGYDEAPDRERNVAVDVSAAGGLQRCHHALNPLGRGGGLSPGGGGCCCCCYCGGGVAVVVLPFDDPREGVVFPPSPPFPSLPGELSFQLTGSL